MPTIRYLPAELMAKHKAMLECVPVSEFMRSPKYQKSKEEWCAAHFSQGYNKYISPCAVHVEEIDPQNDTDLELEVSGERYPVQSTEVQEPGRRRGDEYKTIAIGTESNRDWSPGTKNGSLWIAAAIEKKRDRYGRLSNLNLLVYANFPAYDMSYDQIKLVASEYSEPFASVWLLTGDCMACIRPNPSLGHLPAWLRILGA